MRRHTGRVGVRRSLGRARRQPRRVATAFAFLALLTATTMPQGAAAVGNGEAPPDEPSPVTTPVGSQPGATVRDAAAVPIQVDTRGGDGGPGAGLVDVPIRPATGSYEAPATATEAVGLRTEKSRTYLNPDGTSTVELSQGRLNFRDPFGTWQALDLSLVPTNDPTFGLKVKSTDSAVSLGTSSGSDGLATMTATDGTSITLRAIDGGLATIADDHTSFSGVGGKPVASVYPADTGFEFRSTWADAKTLSYADYALDPHGLAVTANKDGELQLLNPKGELVGIISAPTLFQGDPDAGGAPVEPSPVTVQLIQDGARVGETLVRYQLDPAWLADPERVFPVVLDPTTYCLGAGCATYSSGNFDDFVDSGLPDTYPSGWPVFRVGYDVRTDDGFVFNTMRGLTFFKDISLPDGAVITSATLDYHVGSIYGSALGENVYAYRVTDGDGWSPLETWHKFGTGTGTSGNGDGYTATGGGATTVPAVGNHQTWDVTAITQSWYTRRGPDWQGDLGFAMKMYHEGSSYGEVEYSNYQNSTLSKRPSLSITFETPHVGIDYAADLGANYSPSRMLAGQSINLPLVIHNNGSGFTFDTTNWKVGYRFFDENGGVATSGTQALPSGITSGSSVSVGLTVTPPATPDQYTVRLDLVRTNLASGDEYASDWAQPSLYYSRNKKLVTSDNTRWVGTSVIERDEASVDVVNPGGTPGETQSVDTGDGGTLAINLNGANVTYDGAGGISFADRLPMNLTYGYDSGLGSDCTGILAACAWFTNWDERFIATGPGEYTYQAADGSRSTISTTGDGQLVGGGAGLVSRPRVTIWDEAGVVPSQSWLVAASGESFGTAFSGANVLKVTANASHEVTPTGFQPIDLNTYRVAKFALRTGGPNNVDKAGVGFNIHDVNTGNDRWYMYTAGSADFTLSWPHTFLGYGGATHLYNGWNYYSDDLWSRVKADGSFGASTDSYQITKVWVQTASLGTSSDYTYLDGWRMEPADYNPLADANPSWTSNGTGTATNTTDKVVGSASISIPSTTISGSPDCLSSGCMTSTNLTQYTFESWWWKKVGGKTAAVTFHISNASGRSGAPCATGCDLTYYAGAAAPGGGGTTIQVADTVPTEWTKVTRNVLRDAQQALGLYNDANSVPDPSQPPTQGPTPDDATVTGYKVSGVDGSYLLIDDLRFGSIPDRAADEFGHPSSAGDSTFTYDLSATFADGSIHYFNQDGLLERIADRDGNHVDLDWTITRNVAGQAAYALTTIHAPSDGSTSGSTVYRRQVGVTYSGSDPVIVTFTELLGTTVNPVTGRSTAFTVRKSDDAGGHWTTGDVTTIKPARTPTCAGSGATGCDVLSYTSADTHQLKIAYDPRSTASDTSNLTVTWSSNKPTTITDSSTGGALLKVLSWTVTLPSGVAASKRVLWQDRDDLQAANAEYLDLTADGNALYAYIPLACSGTCSAANPPTDSPDSTRVAESHQFDGVADVSTTITYRCPGVSVTGSACTGTPQRFVSRSASKAAARVDNYIDPLTAGELAWTQGPEQFLASVRDSSGANPDLYRSTYTYNSLGQQASKTDPVFNPQPKFADVVNDTGSEQAYWRLDDASGSALDQTTNHYNLTVTASGVTRGAAGGILNDPDTAMTFAAASSARASTSSLSISQTAYTLEAWFAVTTAAQTNVGIIGDFASNSGAMINLDTNGYVELAHGSARVVSTTVPAVGRWYHVVGTWDGTVLALYVDGQLVAGGTSGTEGTGASTFELADWGNAQAGTFANITIDDAAYFDDDISANDVEAHYQAGRSVAYHTVETLYDAEGHPTQTDDQGLQAGGFESNFNNWRHFGTSAVQTSNAAYIHSGGASYQTGLTGSAYQEVPLVLGQTFRLQLWARTTGTAQPNIGAKYWQLPTHTWVSFSGFSVTEPSSSSFVSYAWDLTLPADTDGRVKITLGVTGGSGTDSVYYDDVAVLTSYARSAYDSSGLLTDTYTFATGSAAEIDTRFEYAVDVSGIAAQAHPAIWPTTVIANYVDGDPAVGPGDDEDVQSERTFDGWGRTLTDMDPDGRVTTSAYDATNLTDLASTTDNAGALTTMTYDLVGNLLSTTSPTGLVSSSTYDLADQVLTTTAPDGTVSRTDYNNWGERVASWANYTTGTTGADHDLATVYAYDDFGNVIQTDVDCSATAGVITLPCTGGLDARTTTTYDMTGQPVAVTTYPDSAGGGTARTTTGYIETYVTPSGSDWWDGLRFARPGTAGTKLAISPSGPLAPVCPSTTSTYCSNAAVWTVNGNVVSGVDMNGRTVGAMNADGVVTASFADMDGRSVETVAGFVAGAAGDSDTNVTTLTVYDIAGRPILSYDPLNRHDDRTYDALGRVLTVAHVGTDHVATQTTTTVYWPSGKIDTTNDGASTTETTYDLAGRAAQTIAHYDTTDAGMAIDAFEGPLSVAWRIGSSDKFLSSAASAMTLDTSTAGNFYGSTPPQSGRGRLHVTTASGSANDGVRWDIPDIAPFKAGHTYEIRFSARASSSAPFHLFLGQDEVGGSYGETTAQTIGTSWASYTQTWTPASDVTTTDVRFAIRYDTAATLQLFLDNVVFWDTPSGGTSWNKRNIVSSQTAYDADGSIIASVLPPGDPTSELPLVTTTAADAAGRTVATVVNDVSGAYAAAIRGTSNLAAYYPLDERSGVTATDKINSGGTNLTVSSQPDWAVAGAIDEARTGVRFSGSAPALSRSTAATTATTNVAIEAWVRTDTIPADGFSHIIAVNGTATDGWGLAITGTGMASGFVQVAGTYTGLASSVSLTDGAWHHLVLTRNTTTWTLYLDKAAVTISNNTLAPSTPGAAFAIGGRDDGTKKFLGDLDEVSVYTANLSSGTVASHYDAGRRDSTDASTALATKTNYDGLGRKVDTWSPALATFTGGLQAPTRTHAVFDRLGHQTETWLNYQVGAATTATGDTNVKSTFAVDVLGEETGYCGAREVNNATGCDPTNGADNRAWHYTFDKMGRQTGTVPPVNANITALTTTKQVYDTDGRLSQTCRYPAGSACAATNSRHVDFTYDALGRVLTQKSYDRTSGSDTLKFTKTLTWNADGSQNSVNEGSQTFNYVYDAAGRLYQFKDGSTVKTAYTYTASTGTVATRTDGTMGITTFSYDWANRETTVTPPAAYTTSTVTRSYRLDGTLDTQAFNGSVTETLSYDAVKRPTQISLNTSGGTSTLSQTYDRGGRVTSDGRSLQGMTGDVGTGTQSFTNDGLGRVTGSSGLTPTSTYSYDLDSDRLTRVDGSTSTTFTYDWTGELYQQTISGSKTFAYDRYGNLTTAWDSSSNSITYAYDEASRPTGITPQTGSAATLTPDALDRTKTRVVGASTDTYGYLGPSTATYETGVATTDALLDVDGSRLAVKTGSTLSWVIFDLHGSIVALCPAGSTTLSDAYRYDAWGQAIGTNPGSATNPWRYRGLLDLSPSTNPILAMGARLYSPSLGAFTQEDTVQGQAANPLSMNRYLYAEANPVTLVDPDGHAVMTTATLCSRFEDYCSAPSTKTSTRTSTKLVYNKDSANYKQKSVSIYANGPRANVVNWGVSCSWCADAVFQRAPSAAEQWREIENDQQRYWDQHPGGGWRSLAIFFGAAIAAGAVAAIIDIPLGSTALSPAVGLAGGAGVSCAEIECAAPPPPVAIGTKIAAQMADRGWSPSSIDAAVNEPATTHPVWDLTGTEPQAATAFVRADGAYVVVNDVTGDVVQVSRVGDPTWKPVWEDPRFQRPGG